MTLNHSKTWPVTTLAVVQLRVDTRGRAYSTLNGQEEAEDHEECHLGAEDTENGVVCPLSKGHLELFNKMSGAGLRTTIRTDTVSTILDQDMEPEIEPEKVKLQEVSEDSSELEKFRVLALTRNEETYNEPECHPPGRRPSIKVDNWDFIYTETKPNRCPIHDCNNSNGPKESNAPVEPRKTTTLRRHYYLEGGWGWVVVFCSVLVHVLNHGIQLSCSQLILPGSQKFKVEAVHFADVFILCYAINDANSWDNVKEKWAPELRRCCPRAKIILAATKNDLYTSREISERDGVKLSKLIKADGFIENSAKLKHNIDETISMALTVVVNSSLTKKSPNNSCHLL